MTPDTYNTRPANDFFIKLNFRESQLEAIREVYHKYFEPVVTKNFLYVGYGITIDWKAKNGDIKEAVPFDDSFKTGERTYGWKFPPTIFDDPIWYKEFGDVIFYMNRDATITIMPPMTVMAPHIDRPDRGHAIYFPISGNTENCYSECYELTKNSDPNIRQTTNQWMPAIHSYSTVDNAYLMNVDEWHGVRNISRQTRIAFGWNTRGGEQKRSFSELKEIFTDLGYIK
jgi:hypothetical protein